MGTDGRKHSASVRAARRNASGKPRCAAANARATFESSIHQLAWKERTGAPASKTQTQGRRLRLHSPVWLRLRPGLRRIPAQPRAQPCPGVQRRLRLRLRPSAHCVGADGSLVLLRPSHPSTQERFVARRHSMERRTGLKAAAKSSRRVAAESGRSTITIWLTQQFG